MKALIAIFIILFTHYDVLRMVNKYGEDSDKYTFGVYLSFLVDAVLFFYAWYKLIEILNN